jgi:DNA-binding Lrp family transcriptional regulator
MSNMPPPHKSDTAALRRLRMLEENGVVQVFRVGKAWRIQGAQHDLMIAGIGWISHSDLYGLKAYAAPS